jgi:hypothetical protein
LMVDEDRRWAQMRCCRSNRGWPETVASTRALEPECFPWGSRPDPLGTTRIVSRRRPPTPSCGCAR